MAKDRKRVPQEEGKGNPAPESVRPAAHAVGSGGGDGATSADRVAEAGASPDVIIPKPRVKSFVRVTPTRRKAPTVGSNAAGSLATGSGNGVGSKPYAASGRGAGTGVGTGSGTASGTAAATDAGAGAKPVSAGGAPRKSKEAAPTASDRGGQREGSKPAKPTGAQSKSRAVARTERRPEPEVVEAELVDDDEDDDDDDEDGGRVVEGEVEFDTHLPAVLGHGPDDGDAPFADVEEADESHHEAAANGGGLVVSSALQRYLAELRKYSLMNVEEEREVAKRAYDQGDMQARNRLVTANLRLVVKIAMEYRRAYSQILDLIQEGNAGLVQAVNRFNPYMNVKLSTYSAWWIRAYILKFLMDNKSLVRMGTTDAQRKLFFRLRAEAEKMYALTQRFDAQLLAENIGVKESDVIEMQQRLTKSDVSLDAPVREDGETRHVDTLVADIAAPDAAFERSQLLALLREKVGEIEKELGERDAFIFRERILADDPVTLQDVGDKFGITRERARQLEARVMKRIKEALVEAGIGGRE